MSRPVVVWSYLHALGADRDVEHARGMAMSMLVVTSAGIAIGLTRLRRAASRWIVLGTLASLGLLVQVPVISQFLNVSPMHVSDWGFVAAVLVLVGAASLMTASWLAKADSSNDC